MAFQVQHGQHPLNLLECRQAGQVRKTGSAAPQICLSVGKLARREAVDQLRLSLEEQYYADRPALADGDDEDLEESASSSAGTTTSSSSLPSSFSKAFWVRCVAASSAAASCCTLTS